jgi:hypothetical protein
VGQVFRRVSSQIVAAAVALILFVITQGILKFIIEPIHEQKKLIGEVANALLFYANVVHLDTWGPPDEERRREMDEARRTLRGLAGRLRESLWTVPFYDTLALLERVPKKEDVLEAATQFVGWSRYSLYGRGEGHQKRRKIIADRLGITKKLGELD